MRKTANPEIGSVYGRLTVIGEAAIKGRSIYIPTRCECGRRKLVMKQNLTKGATKSCGCLNLDLVQERFRKYPPGSRDTYSIWFAMVRRCHNPDDASYGNYGGRGITVCKRWRVFHNFLADMGLAPKGLTLDRLDNDKGYSPSNCAWATRSDNLYNKRTTRFFEFEGEQLHLGEISRRTGISWSNLYRRLVTKGLPMSEAILPVAPRKRTER